MTAFCFEPTPGNNFDRLCCAAQWLQQACDQLEQSGVNRDQVERLRSVVARFEEHGKRLPALRSRLRQLAERLEEVW